MQISFPTQSGATLSGVLEQGRSPGAKTLIVICYGYKSTPDHPAIKIVTDDLKNQGFATFVFKFTSEALAMDIKGQVDDLESIAHYFDNKFSKIVLLASSLGALSASIAAARSDGFHALVTLNGFFGLRYLSPQLRREFTLFRALALLPGKYKRLWHFYKREFRPEKIHIPALVLHCPTDREVLIAQSHYFFDRLTAPKKFQNLKLADHDISQPEDAHTIAATVVAWLRE